MAKTPETRFRFARIAVFALVAVLIGLWFMRASFTRSEPWMKSSLSEPTTPSVQGV